MDDVAAADGAAWWSSQRIAPEIARARLSDGRSSVLALGPLDAGPLSSLLAATGVSVVAADASPQLRVVLAADYLDRDLRALNARALEDGCPWMLARPAAAEVLVGPVFTPDRGPCWECLAQRLRIHRQAERVPAAGAPPASPAPVDVPSSLAGIGTGLVASAVIRWLAGQRLGSESLIASLDTRTLRGGHHTVVWRPQCPACGVAEGDGEPVSAPMWLRARAADRLEAGGLRSVAPEITIRRLEHHVSPLTGVVATLAEVETSAEVHVHVAGPELHQHHGEHAGADADGVSGGKGRTGSQARAGALCEALERYSGRFVPQRSRRSGRYADLADVAIAPPDLLHFSAAQYDERDKGNAAAVTMKTHVPEPFDPHDQIDWTPVWSLTGDRERLLPTAFCWYGARVPGSRYCTGDSNGNASGNTVEEAVLHGLLELVERDHAAVWWYNRLRAAPVALRSADAEWLERLRARLARDGQQLWVLDLTADLGIPVAAAVIADEGRDTLELGFGAHPERDRAAVRAVTEVFQMTAGAPSRGLGGGAAGRVRLSEHRFVAPDAACSPVADDSDRAFRGGVDEALSRCRAAVEAQGIELLVLDQTQPDIGLPVVKVVAPGLRHFWPRLGPGRLYDVPVALGRLDRPRAEAELSRTCPVS